MHSYSPNWYKDFFTDIALDYWQLASAEHDTSDEIAFVSNFVDLKHGDKVLDVFCGHGRHALAYVQKGMVVTAVDVAEPYIKALQRLALLQKLSLKAVCSDVLAWKPTPKMYDLVICMGNSLPYLNREQLEIFLDNIQYCLKKNGSFVFHTSMLAESVFPNLMEYDWKQVGDMTFLLKNTYWVEKGCLENEVTFIKEGNKVKRTMYHYVYSLSEMYYWFKSFGFDVVTVLNTTGEAYEYGDIDAYFVLKLADGDDDGES